MPHWTIKRRREEQRSKERKRRLHSKAQKAGALGAVDAICSTFYSDNKRRGMIATLRSETPRAARN